MITSIWMHVKRSQHYPLIPYVVEAGYPELLIHINKQTGQILHYKRGLITRLRHLPTQPSHLTSNLSASSQLHSSQCTPSKQSPSPSRPSSQQPWPSQTQNHKPSASQPQLQPQDTSVRCATTRASASTDSAAASVSSTATTSNVCSPSTGNTARHAPATATAMFR